MANTMPHPNEANPFGMLALTQWPDGLEFYIRPKGILSIERLPAFTSEQGAEEPERTKLRIAEFAHSGMNLILGTPDVVLVNETPYEIFSRKHWLDKHIGK